MMVTAGLVVLFSLLFIGVPVGFAMMAAGTAGLWMMGGTTMVVGYLSTTPLASASSFELLTIPMFVLMAELVILSGVANSLFGAAAIWVGRVPGGLGIATAFAGAGFGAVCGSSTAAAATLSSTSVPAMIERGYDPRIATGVVAISGTLAMLIPPSIALVLYAIIADQDIGALLIGGVVPGLLITVAIGATVFILAVRHPEQAPAGHRYSMAEKFSALKVAGPILFLFLAVTGIIYLGVATPTEASALGAIGALVLTAINRRLTPGTFLEALKRAAVTTCMILTILMGAHLFGYFVTLSRLTQNLIGFVDGLDLPPQMVLFFVLSLFFILGCIMDQAAILILTVPILLPLMTRLGFDPIWFGIIVIVMAEIGLVTPPLGLNAFVVSKYTGRKLEEVFAGLWPHIFAHLLVVLLLCLFPAIVTWLPGKMR